MFVVVFAAAVATVRGAAPVDWIERSPNGAYQFAYATGDEGGHYRTELAAADNTLSGRFGSRDPATGANAETTYTAGRRGFRARGPNIARRMSLSQAGPVRPHDDGQYHPELDLADPSEDRGYDFQQKTRTYVKEEHADARGDVRGRYSYFDDVGAQHTVDYSAGAGTGFNVHNAVPDTIQQAQSSPLYFQGKGPASKARGFTAVQKGLDGSYRFAASGPDHKRAEVSDSRGNVRGSYTYLDDTGVQRTVEYIAGPNIGYQVINNRRPFLFGSTLSPLLPTSPTNLPTPSPPFTDLLATPSPPFTDLLAKPSPPFTDLLGNPSPPFTDLLGNPSPPFTDILGTPSPTYPDLNPKPSPTYPSPPFSNQNKPSSGLDNSNQSPTPSTFPAQTPGFGTSTPSPGTSTTSTSGFPSTTLTPPLVSTNEWGPVPSTPTSPWVNYLGPEFGDLGQLQQRPPTGPTFPKDNSYSTCCYGAWHMGPKHRPNFRGVRTSGDGRSETEAVAIRAHVQSVSANNVRRHLSPGEALELYNSASVNSESVASRSR